MRFGDMLGYTPPDVILSALTADRRSAVTIALQEAAKTYPIVLSGLDQHQAHESPSTRSHVFDVVDLVESFCDRFAISPQERDFRIAGAVLHDIGKTELDPALFEVTEKVPEDDPRKTIIRSHALRGYLWVKERTKNEGEEEREEFSQADLAYFPYGHHLPEYPDQNAIDAVFIPPHMERCIVELAVADKIAAQAVPRPYRKWPIIRSEVKTNILKILPGEAPLIDVFLDLHPRYKTQPPEYGEDVV